MLPPVVARNRFGIPRCSHPCTHARGHACINMHKHTCTRTLRPMLQRDPLGRRPAAHRDRLRHDTPVRSQQRPGTDRATNTRHLTVGLVRSCHHSISTIKLHGACTLHGACDICCKWQGMQCSHVGRRMFAACPHVGMWFHIALRVGHACSMLAYASWCAVTDQEYWRIYLVARI